MIAKPEKQPMPVTQIREERSRQWYRLVSTNLPTKTVRLKDAAFDKLDCSQEFSKSRWTFILPSGICLQSGEPTNQFTSKPLPWPTRRPPPPTARPPEDPNPTKRGRHLPRLRSKHARSRHHNQWQSPNAAASIIFAFLRESCA